jgi:hypothetical protein
LIVAWCKEAGSSGVENPLPYRYLEDYPADPGKANGLNGEGEIEWGVLGPISAVVSFAEETHISVRTVEETFSLVTLFWIDDLIYCALVICFLI